MDRRRFGRLCTGTMLAPGLAAWAGPIADYAPARLVGEGGLPLKAAEVGADEALVFAYPYVGIPCYLINLGARRVRVQERVSPDDGAYRNPQGVGQAANLVAFIAVCTHQMSYPTPEASYLRYAASGSTLAGAPGRIVCCAHGSIFDPADGAQKVAGPAPNPLLPVRLAHDPQSDGLSATGTIGENFFKRFFATYKADLIERFGPGGYRQPVAAETLALPLSRYARLVSDC